MVRFIAFYLPQYYPIPENDTWWGKGFTEWTNVTKAKPLYKGHMQPFLPSDLGFYDLRVPEVRDAQATLASTYGIEGFCYWHYWFGNGRRILSEVLTEVIDSGKPDYPFCLAWANQSWTGRWHGNENDILMKQTYQGVNDYKAHFYDMLPAFRDYRYIRIKGRLLFIIYNPRDIPDPEVFMSCWRGLAAQERVDDFYFIALDNSPSADRYGMDGISSHEPTSHNLIVSSKRQGLFSRLGKPKLPMRVKYNDFVHVTHNTALKPNQFPVVLPNWDNTPRSGINGLVFEESSPEFYGRHLEKAMSLVADREEQERIVFIKSWNEWAEGNVLEPSQNFGIKYLETTRSVMDMFNP